MKIDPKIDALFQLPLDQFTQKRNALAKELSGESKKQVKFLAKPPLPIWAVNQLYWHERPTYSALIDASEKLRAAHRSALSGHETDLRKPEQLHRAALEKAVAKAIGLLEKSEGTVSDAARDTIRKALGALPNDEDPGRMTRTPEAAGFSLLTGIKPTVGRDFSRAKPKKQRDLSPALPKQDSAATAKAEAARRHAEAAIAAKAAKRAAAIADADRELQRARKSAEQAKFLVRKRQTDLENAQAAEERLAADVAVAQRKLDELRRR